MKTSNISYLRNHLSEVLACVKEGETVLVLDRDKPVACLSPYATPADSTPMRLLELQRQGLMRRENPEAPPKLRTPLSLKQSVDLTRYLQEDRGEL